MQVRMQRLEGTLDIYQTNPFLIPKTDDEIGSYVHELAVQDMPASVEDIRHMDDDEADREALSQAIEMMVRVGRTCRVKKVVEYGEQVRLAKLPEKLTGLSNRWS